MTPDDSDMAEQQDGPARPNYTFTVDPTRTTDVFDSTHAASFPIWEDGASTVQTFHQNHLPVPVSYAGAPDIGHPTMRSDASAMENHDPHGHPSGGNASTASDTSTTGHTPPPPYNFPLHTTNDTNQGSSNGTSPTPPAPVTYTPLNRGPSDGGADVGGRSTTVHNPASDSIHTGLPHVHQTTSSIATFLTVYSHPAARGVLRRAHLPAPDAEFTVSPSGEVVQRREGGGHERIHPADAPPDYISANMRGNGIHNTNPRVGATANGATYNSDLASAEEGIGSVHIRDPPVRDKGKGKAKDVSMPSVPMGTSMLMDSRAMSTPKPNQSRPPKPSMSTFAHDFYQFLDDDDDIRHALETSLPPYAPYPAHTLAESSTQAQARARVGGKRKRGHKATKRGAKDYILDEGGINQASGPSSPRTNTRTVHAGWSIPGDASTSSFPQDSLEWAAASLFWPLSEANGAGSSAQGDTSMESIRNTSTGAVQNASESAGANTRAPSANEGGTSTRSVQTTQWGSRSSSNLARVQTPTGRVQVNASASATAYAARTLDARHTEVDTGDTGDTTMASITTTASGCPQNTSMGSIQNTTGPDRANVSGLATANAVRTVYTPDTAGGYTSMASSNANATGNSARMGPGANAADNHEGDTSMVSNVTNTARGVSMEAAKDVMEAGADMSNDAMDVD